MTLSEILKNYRVEHKLSQRDLARKCDLSHGLISLIERGQNPQTGKPMQQDLETYKKLADGMGTTLQDLFERIDDSASVSVKSRRLFAMDSMPKKPGSRVIGTFSATETMQRGIEKIAYVPGAEKAELDPESRMILGMLKSAKPEKRKAAIKVLKAMMEDD